MLTTRMLLLAVALVGLAGCVSTAGVSNGFLYSEFVPETRQGPVVLVLSGSAGPGPVRFIADDLAKAGYYAILIDGHYFHGDWLRGHDNPRKLIALAQQSPHARAGKVGVIGFSMGGTGVLVHASTMEDSVAVSVAYFPGTSSSWIRDKDALIHRWTVPMLAFAGEWDGSMGGRCCLVETIRGMAATAKEFGAPFELVTYPRAGHDFNWRGAPSYEPDAARDSWRRTLAVLRQRLTA
jgi:dienelactone hydrolase